MKKITEILDNPKRMHNLMQNSLQILLIVALLLGITVVSWLFAVAYQVEGTFHDRCLEYARNISNNSVEWKTSGPYGHVLNFTM